VVSFANAGRVLMATLKPGDEMVASIQELADVAQLDAALIFVRGELVSGELILGFRKYSRATNDLERGTFEDSRQILGFGELMRLQDGPMQIAVRCSVAREREVFIGDVVRGAVGESLRITLVEVVEPFDEQEESPS
jgi:predicted DNA-binding protein with PD1-like motif